MAAPEFLGGLERPESLPVKPSGVDRRGQPVRRRAGQVVLAGLVNLPLLFGDLLLFGLLLLLALLSFSASPSCLLFLHAARHCRWQFRRQLQFVLLLEQSWTSTTAHVRSPSG